MREDFKLSETALLGRTLDELRRSVSWEGHPLSGNMLCGVVGMSPKTYRKVVSGVAVMQDTTCGC